MLADFDLMSVNSNGGQNSYAPSTFLNMVNYMTSVLMPTKPLATDDCASRIVELGKLRKMPEARIEVAEFRTIPVDTFLFSSAKPNSN